MEDKNSENISKKRILLIYPPSPVLNREDRCQQPTKELLVIPPLPPTDLMYLAAVAEKTGLEAKIILQVHDEMMIEAPENEKEEVKDIMKREMESAIQLKIPLVAEISEAKNWYDCK